MKCPYCKERVKEGFNDGKKVLLEKTIEHMQRGLNFIHWIPHNCSFVDS